MNSDVKMGFWVGIGLLAALVIWHVAARFGIGALNSAGSLG